MDNDHAVVAEAVSHSSFGDNVRGKAAPND